MAGQFQDLLRQVDTKLAGVERLLNDTREREQQLERELGKLRIRITQMEQDEKWRNKERENVDGRLKTGDGMFQTLQRDVAEAKRIAKWCEERLQPKPTSWRKKWAKPLLEAAAPIFVSLIWWLFYHFLLIGPEIAKALKAIKDMGGHP